MLKAVAPFAMLLMVILLVSTPSFAFASSSHPFISQWGESGIGTAGHFINPQAAAVDSDGNVYVTDLGNMRVQKFDNHGNFLNAWGSSGSGAGQFKSPIGIAVYENSVFVVDSQLNKVQKFDTDGNFISQWGVQGDNHAEFLLPNGVATGFNGTVYVVDTGNHRIQIFNSDGEYISEFGQSGTTDDAFISPIGITIDNQENVYVSDSGSTSIKKFDSDGEFLDIFDSSVGGSPIRAQGLQSDPEGNLYVADSNNDRVLRLDSQGTAIAVWGSMGINPSQFKMPKDVALDNNGNLFVVDSNGHRIQKFATPLEITIIEPEVTEEPEPPVEESTQNDLPPVNPVPGDLTKPVISPPNDLVIEATGALTTVNVGQAIVSDESGIQSLTNNAPNEFTLGINTVIWTAIDGAGNMAIATQSVTITDTIPPTISDATNITIEATNPTQNQVELEAPIASDVVGIISLENDAPESFPIGQTIVTWTASDIVGNTASTQQIVNVIDTTTPTLHVPEDVIVEATSFEENQVFLGEASVIDNGEIISVTNDAPELFALGNTTVTWFASDASGNVATSSQLVSIIDSTAPEIISPADITFEATSIDSNVIDLGIPQVSDIQDVTISNDSPQVFPLGDTLVTWSAIDSDGNRADSAQTVSVVDTTAPTITIPEDITVEASGLNGNIANLGDIIVEDVSGISSISNDSPESFSLGETIVTWTIEDNSGNVATAEQTVIVVDTTSPSITAPSDITIEASSIDDNSADLGQPSASDLVEVAAISNDAPQSYPIGVTTVTWSAVDTSGNIASDTQIITVEDTTSPEIISPDDITVEATAPDGEIISIGDATATDVIGIDSITNDAPSIFPLGETIVTWSATDLYGNSAQSTQRINVVDSTSPTLTVPDNVTVEADNPSSNIVDIGTAQAEDLVGVIYVENDAPESYSVGETTVTWTASDAAGNIVTDTQIITVTDSLPPTIIAPDDVISEATSADNNIVNVIGANATDAVGVVSISHDAPEFFPVGDTIVTWTATDAAGNTATDSQIISIVDTTAPALYAPTSITVEASNQFDNVVEFGTATATDAVGVTSISNDAPSVFPLGLTSITWTAADAAGNEYSAIQQVIVVDTTEPSITAPSDIVLEADSALSNVVELGQADANDTVLLESVTNDAPSEFSLGETIVTWSALDSSGNTASTTQIITLVDTTAPTITSPDDIILEATSQNSNVVSMGNPIADDSVSDVTISNDAPAVFSLGETIVTWTASDDAGNTASDTQSITIVDTTSPIITVPEDIIVEATSQLENIIEIGNAFADDLVSVSSLTNDAPDVFPYGDTIVTWTATDSSGNSKSDTQLISVIDTTAPTLTPPPNVTIEAVAPIGNIVQIGSATTDDIIEIASLTNDAPDSFLLGDTIVTWTSVDQDGNTATATQLVSVVDTTAPELVVPSNIIIDAISLDTPVDIGTATSTDLIDSNPAISNDSTGIFPLGQSTVTWNSVDMFGNAVSVTQTVDVQACGKPIDYYNMILGTAEDDIISGTSQPDLIFALGGDDIISGDKGNDCIFGGEGDDIIFGQEGNDNISGDEGNDIIKGQSGIDSISGKSGIDVIDGGDDSDSCNVTDESDGDLIVKCEF